MGHTLVVYKHNNAFLFIQYHKTSYIPSVEEIVKHFVYIEILLATSTITGQTTGDGLGGGRALQNNIQVEFLIFVLYVLNLIIFETLIVTYNKIKDSATSTSTKPLHLEHLQQLPTISSMAVVQVEDLK
jgi:hypothetical protein